MDGQLPTHQSQLPLIEFPQLSILWHNTTHSNLLSTGSIHLNLWFQRDELFFGCFCSGGEDVKCCFDLFCSVLLMIMHPESHTLWYQFKPWVKLSTSFIREILPIHLPWGRTQVFSYISHPPGLSSIFSYSTTLSAVSPTVSFPFIDLLPILITRVYNIQYITHLF